MLKKSLPPVKLILILLLLSMVQAARGDVLELKNGDRISGRILSMNEQTVKFKTNYGIIDIPRTEITYGEFGDSQAKSATPVPEETATTQKKKEASLVPVDGLILECLFDGYFRDSSSSNYPVRKVNNVFFIPGINQKVNTAVLSDGTGTYLEVDNNAVLENLDSFTLSCWAYIQAETGNQYLAAKWEKTTGQKADGKFALSYGKGNIYFYIVDETGYFHGIKQEAAITLQTWYHITVTFAKGKLKLYLNGARLSEKEVQAKGLFKDKSTLYLMTAKSFGTEGWSYYNMSGRLDNLRLYNRELSPEEIRLLYLEKNGS